VRPDIGALAAWNITTRSASVVIAVIDTGVDYKRVDLAANMWVNPTECNNSGLDNDGNGYVNDCHGVNAITHSGDPMQGSPRMFLTLELGVLGRGRSRVVRRFARRPSESG